MQRLRPGLGTLIAIEAWAATESIAMSAIEAAFAACSEMQRLLHPQTPGSDLARINGAPPRLWIAVSPETARLLSLARELHELTAGAFDPCCPARPGRFAHLELKGAAVSCRQPVLLDFGGFAKGFAVDRAIEQLRQRGCSAGLVNAGGDLRTFGDRPEPLLLRLPGNRLRRLAVQDVALAVSELAGLSPPSEHVGIYHRLQGTAAMQCAFAAVTAPEAVLADALTKVVLLCPGIQAEQVLARFDAQRL
ncbi:MAG: FAD:protein FMN transferase [Sinobacteraceae bacterium]|nr:FAD:protein FMN transferase [Nevskiaceae bacterium]